MTSASFPRVEPTAKRASSSPPAARRSIVEALATLAGESRGLGHPTLDTADLGARLVRARVMLDRAVALLSELQRQEAGDEEVEIDGFDDMFSDAPEPARSSRATVADLCFAGLMETKASLRDLAEAREEDAVEAALESAARKLGRALRAVVSRAVEGTSMPPIPAATTEEIDAALAVRRVYAKFRRGLRRADAATPEGVLRAVQYAAGAIATLTSAAEYGALRSSDRAMLRGLRARAFAWARGARVIEDGLSVLEDIHTSADLLRGINQRQELRVHDWDTLARLPGARENERVVLLMRLEGLDDELDRFIDRMRNGDNVEELWPLVARRIGDLR